jgi:hypothetical protein
MTTTQRDGLSKSAATLPDGRTVLLFWDRGDCVDARIGDEPIDLFSVFGSRELAEAWLDERTDAKMVTG